MSTVAITVDPAYGPMLFDVPKGVPVWIVDTPTNSEAAGEARGRSMSVTTYQCPDVSDRVANLRGMIPAVEMHHGRMVGDYLVFGDDSKVKVIGLAGSDDAFEALREFGLKRFSEAPGGFIAAR